MNFFFQKVEGRSLSNFWEGQVRIGDRVYGSGECGFQGEKFFRVSRYSTDSRKQELISYGEKFLTCTSGAVVKRMGRALRLTPEELDIWNRESIHVQEEICQYKFDTYEEVREDLRKSKGKWLIHPAMRCSDDKVKHRVWEGRVVMIEGNPTILGGNQLGNIWMRLRDSKI